MDFLVPFIALVLAYGAGMLVGFGMGRIAGERRVIKRLEKVQRWGGNA